MLENLFPLFLPIRLYNFFKLSSFLWWLINSSLGFPRRGSFTSFLSTFPLCERLRRLYLARGSAAILSSSFLAFIFAILLGWPFLIFTSFPSMREIPFIGSLFTSPTWIGPFFHLDFRVILHNGIFILFPTIRSICTVSRAASMTPFGTLSRRSNDWDAPVSRKIDTSTGPPFGPLITLLFVQGR